MVLNMAADKELAKKLMKATKSKNHNKELASVLTDFLKTRVQVPITYTGIISGTPPIPDPIIADTLLIVGKMPDLNSSDFNTWVSSIESGIMEFELINPGIAGIKPTQSLKLFKKGLDITQDMIKIIHENPPQEIYKWEQIDDSEIIEENTKEFNSVSELPTDRFISNFAKIKNIDKEGNVFYKYYESIYTVSKLVWEEISKQIINWIKNPTLHTTTFPAQGTSTGSTGTATILPILVL